MYEYLAHCGTIAQTKIVTIFIFALVQSLILFMAVLLKTSYDIALYCFRLMY
jgi:hypothetical protein